MACATKRNKNPSNRKKKWLTNTWKRANGGGDKIVKSGRSCGVRPPANPEADDPTSPRRPSRQRLRASSPPNRRRCALRPWEPARVRWRGCALRHPPSPSAGPDRGARTASSLPSTLRRGNPMSPAPRNADGDGDRNGDCDGDGDARRESRMAEATWRK
jgi:hypothetical protein